MNLFGEGFPKEINKQIDVRQKVHALGFNGSRTTDSHLYKNANSAWCKLISSTDVSHPEFLVNTNIKSLGYSGDSLAKDFVLFNGTSLDSTPNNRAGYGFEDSALPPSHAYTSWGKIFPNADFGFRPMAGITGVSVKHKNRGTIRAATVNIKAWDKISFEIIDVLYLRLGFSVLLEWGNSMYYDNNGNLLKDEDNSLADDFLNGTGTYYSFLDKIKAQQIKSFGNYDAMFGKVTNMHWSYQPDGSYDIALDLISGGDIIESFKVKGKALSSTANLPTSTATTPVSSSGLDNPDIDKVLATYAKSSDIAYYLYGKTTELVNNGITPTGVTTVYMYNGKPVPYVLKNSKGDGEVVRMFPMVVSGVGANVSHYFIRLGDFLEFIQNKILYVIKNNGGSVPFLKIDTNTETNLMHAPDQLLSYDPRVCMVRRDVHFPESVPPAPPVTTTTTTNTNTNAVTTTTGIFNRVSGAPNLGVPPPGSSNSTYLAASGTPTPAAYSGTPPPAAVPVTSSFEEYFSHPYGDSTYEDTNNINQFLVGSKLDDVGKIMNIYINFKFIITKLQVLSDTDTNTVTLYDFLKDLVSNINSAFGGYSKLDLWIDEESNTLKIIDQNPLPSNRAALDYIGSANKELAYFNLTGYATLDSGQKDAQGNPVQYSYGGFIRDFKFNTELTPDFATMITVSATNQGNVVGENNTALSLLNRGLKDRFKEEINGGGKPVVKTTTVADLLQNYKDAEKEYSDFLDGLKDYLYNVYNNIYLPEEIDDYKSAYTVFLQLYKKYEQSKTAYEKGTSSATTPSSNSKFQPGTGFIPFNLSLTMDGLSGMKIGTKFLIDTTYLPSNYPDTVDFLIKSLNHEIKDNQWTTTIESFCIAQGNDSNRTKTKTKGKKRTAPVKKDDKKLDPKNPVDTNAVGAWRISNGGNSNVTSAYDLRYHHDTKNWETDKNQAYGKWSLNKSGTSYVYDMVLSREENGVRTTRPSVPSPVAGEVIRVKPDSAGNGFLSIKADDGTGVYSLLHMDNYAVDLGDKVTRGQLIARQSDVMPTTKINGGKTVVKPNVHLHIQFPSKQVLVDYINDLVNNSF